MVLVALCSVDGCRTEHILSLFISHRQLQRFVLTVILCQLYSKRFRIKNQRFTAKNNIFCKTLDIFKKRARMIV